MSRIETRLRRLEAEIEAGTDDPFVIHIGPGRKRGNLLGLQPAGRGAGPVVMRSKGESEESLTERAIAQELPTRKPHCALLFIEIRDKVWHSLGKVYGLRHDGRSGRWSFLIYGSDETEVIYRGSAGAYDSHEAASAAAQKWFEQ